MPPTSSSTPRLAQLSKHLAAPTMSAEKKPPITCHVLDTTIGRPGANIPVTLTYYPSSSAQQTTQTFTSKTNSDGRVTAWSPCSSVPFTDPGSLESLFSVEGGDQMYSLTFETKEYFETKGQETFFPEVVVKFVVKENQRKKGEHFHVPVLLSGYGYSTYRGS